MKALYMATAVYMLSACANTDIPYFSIEKPNTVAAREYLKDYGVLKSYVDRTKSPSFKLGAALSASDFNKQDLEYAVAIENFDELVTGNAFKYASVVKDDGSMDFGTITKFVQTATAAGATVYGHTLCWHSQQNITYLKSLITSPNTVNHVLHAQTPEAKTNIWDWNMSLALNAPLTVGKEYTLKMRVKASSEYTVTVWPRIDGGTVQYWPTPSVAAGTEWTTIKSSFEAKHAINTLGFQFGPFKGDIYMDDVSLTDADGKEYVDNGKFDEGLDSWSKPGYLNYTLERVKDPDQTGDTGGLSEQTVKDTLTWAMANWIKGMMEACDGKVKAWDAVNEPMSDGSPTELKSIKHEGDAKKDFFWQDYWGKDYARTVVRLARQYGPKDLKLFINDHGLEGHYGNNAKCRGLIAMVKYWESDGKTKIDGIGTQMHVTYSLDSIIQHRNEEAYVKHLQLLAATGKLVRISELDMGLSDAEGKTIKTTDATEEQLKGMADYYHFIVQKYLEIVPPAQQYGITQWALQDSPENSGWRKGEPIGLWDANYHRKPAYGGFADALQGK